MVAEIATLPEFNYTGGYDGLVGNAAEILQILDRVAGRVTLRERRNPVDSHRAEL